MKSSSITIKNHKDIHKPNEDYCLCDDERGIYLLVDGVSRDKINGVYPNPSPSFYVSKLFAESAYKVLSMSICKNTNILDVLYNAVKNGNEEIKQYNDKYEWVDFFLPGTVGIAVVIKDHKLYYAYIGDCYGLIVNSDKHIFTKCQTENITKHKREFSAFEIRNKICNNKVHPYAYGVLNGDVRAMDFVNYGIIEIRNIDRIILCSDGFADIVKNLPCDKMYSMTVEQMAESSIECDDKTMIIIEGNAHDKENI